MRWKVKTDGGGIYEYMGHCDCKRGKDWGHLISASAILDPFEISAIAKDNREWHEKMGGGLQKYEELKNG